MLRKIIITFFLFFPAYVSSEIMPLINFDNDLKSIKSIDSWFTKNYQTHQYLQDKIIPELYAFYGVKGSGISSVDGWFFSCQKNGNVCHLICMADFGDSKNFTPAQIQLDSENFTIAKDKVKMVFKV
ncbi:hypothetical protein K7016_001609, partial [Escherichia coli]|nr:hypothetical protein [Escherichia coli]EIH7423102.1 hypothetical protein [Escherichia coli]